MKQNLTIVKFLGAVALLSVVAVCALLMTGHAIEAGITGLVGVASGAVGQLGGVLRGSKDDEGES